MGVTKTGWLNVCLSNSVLEDKEKIRSTIAYASTTANCRPKIEEVKREIKRKDELCKDVREVWW